LALAHFEEAVDDEDEFWEIGGKSSGTSFPEFGSSELWSAGIEVLVVDLGVLPQVVSFRRWRLWSGAWGGSSWRVWLPVFGLLEAVFVLAWYLKWMGLVMSVDCLWLANCLSLGLVERLEAVQALEEPLEERCWPE
jgi:hypothetical protein